MGNKPSILIDTRQDYEKAIENMCKKRSSDTRPQKRTVSKKKKSSNTKGLDIENGLLEIQKLHLLDR